MAHSSHTIGSDGIRISILTLDLPKFPQSLARRGEASRIRHCCSNSSCHSCHHMAHCTAREMFSIILNRMMSSCGRSSHWFSQNLGMHTGRLSLMLGGPPMCCAQYEPHGSSLQGV